MSLKSVRQGFQVNLDQFYSEPLPDMTDNFSLFSRVLPECECFLPQAGLSDREYCCPTSTHPGECSSARVDRPGISSPGVHCPWPPRAHARELTHELAHFQSTPTHGLHAGCTGPQSPKIPSTFPMRACAPARKSQRNSTTAFRGACPPPQLQRLYHSP